VVSAGLVKTFRNVGDGKNATADLLGKGNLRVKRRDPWLQVNAPSKAAVALRRVGGDAVRFTDVSAPGLQAGGATTSPSELKSLTQYFKAPAKRDLGRPCYEAENSACRGE
jgi:hypothetical protein